MKKVVEGLIPQRLNDDQLVEVIRRLTNVANFDNISRTKKYWTFFKKHPEISWSFLASMVSRNAGWNMCDVYSPIYAGLLSDAYRKKLLLTYERANWLIFRDAYPQLLLYHYSTKMNRDLFHLLECFHVSNFMKKEWGRYSETRDGLRLLYALIINEQHVIDQPVLQQPSYKKEIFSSPAFFLQERFHMNSVVFPTIQGQLFGQSVTRFKTVGKRIELGKRLAAILFHEDLHPLFLQFANQTEHTGSRRDYERYLNERMVWQTPYLRTVMPIISHHVRCEKDWSLKKSVKKQWFEQSVSPEVLPITDWYKEKRNQIELLFHMKRFVASKKDHRM